MKILLLTTYFEPDSGAAAVRLSRLAHLLHERGHEITALAAQAGVTAEMINEAGAGLFVPCGDVKGLATAVEKLLDDPDFRQQCSQNACAYAESNFDPVRVAEAYERVLQEAISDP